MVSAFAVNQVLKKDEKRKKKILALEGLCVNVLLNIYSHFTTGKVIRRTSSQNCYAFV